MPLSQSSLAAVVGAAVENVQFQSEANVLPRKIVIVGTYDPAETAVVDEVPVLVTSPADVGDQFGFGFMAHRLAKKAYLGSQGVETWIQPQAEAGGAAASTGDITFSGTATEAGTIYLYIAGDLVQATVANGDAFGAVATAVETAMAADPDLPVTGVATLGAVDMTSKTKGPWGDDISITLNEGFQEALPAGITAVITGMTGGSGVPTIKDALDGLGTGDDANEKNFTDFIHGYGQDTTSLNSIRDYVGAGNDFWGLYKKTVARPFRSLVGDVTAGSGGLSALVTLGDGRKTDRANGVIAVPGSPNHPEEIAALALGIMARLNNDRAEEHYIGKILTGIWPGALADRWTSDYDSRDTAVKAGVSPTTISGGSVLMSNVLTFYHPDSVADSSNGYRSQRNISILQNILNTVKTNFEQEKWLGTSIVGDVAKVSNATSRLKARDVNAVLDDVVALVNGFEGNAWIYTAAWTLAKIQANVGNYIEIRAGGLGFNVIIPVLLSGEAGIFDNLIQFDTSLAVLLS